MQPAIQLYTLRDLDTTLPDLLKRIGDTAFEGVEFAGLDDSDPEEIRDSLDAAGLDAAAAHVGIDTLEADPAGVAETYRLLDCERLVVPYLDESHFASEAALNNTARRLRELDARLADSDVELGYHNHDHEFVTFDSESASDDQSDSEGQSATDDQSASDGQSATEGQTATDGQSALDALAAKTDFDLELDLGWATAAGRDPVDLLGAYRGRVPVVHLKDVSGNTPVELGTGELDLDACVRAAREAGTEWLVYEHDDPDDPEESLAHGAETLAELLD